MRETPACSGRVDNSGVARQGDQDAGLTINIAIETPSLVARLSLVRR